MLQKLKEAEARYEKIEEDLAKPEIVADQNEFRRLMREYKQITPLIEKYRFYSKITSEAEDARAMLEESLEPDMREMVQEEFKSLKEQIARTEEELKLLLIPRDENDDKNVIIEIRGGAGGEEAALFAGVLYRMYSMYADSAGFKTELLSANETELGGFKEVTFMVSGDGAYSRLKYESGVHRIQRVPETETAGRIHTSTATVAVLPEAEDVEITINPADLLIETIKSSGAGGQHVNKTESAIRMIHKSRIVAMSFCEPRS